MQCNQCLFSNRLLLLLFFIRTSIVYIYISRMGSRLWIVWFLHSVCIHLHTLMISFFANYICCKHAWTCMVCTRIICAESLSIKYFHPATKTKSQKQNNGSRIRTNSMWVCQNSIEIEIQIISRFLCGFMRCNTNCTALFLVCHLRWFSSRPHSSAVAKNRTVFGCICRSFI